jgi:hypothetical protein
MLEQALAVSPTIGCWFDYSGSQSRPQGHDCALLRDDVHWHRAVIPGATDAAASMNRQ